MSHSVTGVSTRAPISDDFSPCTIKIYLSDVIKSDLTSNDGTIAVVAILVIFSFKSFEPLCILYESLFCSSAIVYSNFFSAARNHLYDAQEQYIYPEVTGIFADNVQKEIQRK